MKRTRSRLIAGSMLLGLIVLGSAITWIISAPRSRLTHSDLVLLERPGDPEKGRLVFTAADCASCHASPGQPERTHLGGGLALASPFGTFHVPNISPDPQDGIGKWRTRDLADALLSGVSPSGEHYYPALPYTSYAMMTIEDVRNLMAYLLTLPRVSGTPSPHELTFPFDVRRLVGLWKLIFFHPRRSESASEPLNSLNRGRYLVEVLGHCAECHSPRNLLGGIKRGTRFAGGADPEGVGFAPNITPAGIGGWSKDEIIETLTHRRTPAFRVIGSSMADVVTDISQLSRSDQEAIASYLKTLPARPTPSP